jgi:hypothetical protein
VPVPGFASEKCAQRNRIAAAKGFETASIRLSGGGGKLGRLAIPDGAELLQTYESRPFPERGDKEAALASINEVLPDGAPELTEGDVHLHWVEAASSRFIDDRFAFLDGSTLVNIATGGAAGVAFMNSHRTGGFSTESELPFGKTFGGRYEAFLLPDGQVFERSLLGLYMLRGCAPSGASGPDTDTLSRMIDGGVLQDVSVGLGAGDEGWLRCDVCSRDVRHRDCAHYPGTTYEMSPAEMDAQRRRGVLSGRATYTLMHFGIGEVSGVYDGAVPGAGFRKGYEVFTAGTLSDAAAVEFAEAFGQFLKER